jgi:hypothetical protein
MGSYRGGWCSFLLICSVMFIVMLARVPMFAQTPTSTILGVVKDVQGGTIPGATVTVVNIETGITRSASTGNDGAYRFSALNVGSYQIQVVKDGFETAQRKGIALDVAQSAEIDLTLRIGATGDTVTVTGETPLVQTTSSTGGGLVNQQQISDLPLNGRNLIDLTLMQPGISQTTVLPILTQTSGMQTGVTMSANGAGPHSNNVFLDGANEINFWGLNGSSILGTTLGVDGVQEYKVVTILPDAEYGLLMGAQTIIVSKGGTNKWHGDAFDYLRNSSMDARNYFDTLDTLNFNGFGTNKSFDFPGKRLPPFHRNNFGGSVGGPIKTDRLFIESVYEGFRQRWGQTISTTTLPGNCFDQTSGDSTYHQITEGSLLGCAGLNPATTVVNPAVIAALTTPNIIPGYVGFFPYPNVNVTSGGIELPGATSNYTFRYIQPQSEDYGQMRVDYTISPSDSIFGRYTQDDSREVVNQSYAYQQIPEFEGAQFATLSWTHIFSPNILNTFRSSLSRTKIQGNSTTSPRINSSFVLQPGQDYGGFTPYAGITGVTPLTLDGYYINNIYSFSDDVYWTKGKHAFKFGELFDWNRVPYNGHFNNRGSISFNTLPNMVQGIYSSMTALGGTLSPSQNRQFQYMSQGAYIQDDYRVVPRLTLNLGFRYEFTTIPTEMNGRQYQIRDVATANVNNGTYGAVAGPFWGNNPSLHAFAPRVGFVWDTFGNGKMAIRGGGGIYYDISNFGGLLSNIAVSGPPLDFFNTINNSYSTVSAMQAAGYPLFAFPLPIAYGSAPVTASNPNGVVSTVAGALAPRNWSYVQHQPTMFQWNLTIDRQLPGNEDLTVGYVGTRGVHLVTLAEGNPTDILGYIPNAFRGHALPYYCHPLDNPTGPPTATDQCPTTAAYPAKSNPSYGVVNQNTDTSESWYEALQVNWTQRTNHGLQGGVAFTWSKAEDMGQTQQGDEATAGAQIYFPQVRFMDKSVSGFNPAVNLRANVIYHIPTINAFHGRVTGGLVNGWWVSSIISAVSGLPFNPTIGNRSLSNNPVGTGAASDRPNLDPSFNMKKLITHNPSNWFNESMYDMPIAGTLGTAPRFGVRGPDLGTVDFSLNKDTKAGFLGKTGMIEARADVFNIANRANFGSPTAALSSALATPQCGGGLTLTCQFNVRGAVANPALITPTATAGQVTGTNTRSRQIQLSLKAIF